jgi:hypothetical protein
MSTHIHGHPFARLNIAQREAARHIRLSGWIASSLIWVERS